MNTRKVIRLLPSLLLVAVSAGCIEREGRPVNPCTNVTIGQAIQVNNVDKVDLLFMVDNSNSMGEEQASLANEFEAMIRILTSGDFDQDGSLDGEDDFDAVKDLNVGIITSDMGVGGHTVPTCEARDFGDDGVLRTQGRTDMTGCMATYPSFLNFQPARDAGMEAQFATDVACVANVGTGGCGFEQQLEAILKAVSPSAPTAWTAPDFTPPMFHMNTRGHADVANDGFVRENSVLAIIPVTDEEDCSAADPELFNPSSPTYGATDLNLRCWAHGDMALHPISRYVEGLLDLRLRPNLLIYAPIAGVPTDLAQVPGEPIAWDALVGSPDVRDPRMVEAVDPTMTNRLTPSCNVPGRGIAFPPVRITRVARELQARGAGVTVQSICQESFAPALREIIRQIASALGAACLPRRLNVEADGTVSCDVVTVMPEGMGCDVLGEAGSPQLDSDGNPVFEGDLNQAVCTLNQLVPTAENIGSGSPPSGAGWYYDYYTTEGFDNCGQPDSPTAPWQRIAFTAQPPSGAEVRLECFQSVQGGGTETEVGLGTFCDPDSPQGTLPTDPNPCGATAGDPALTCNPVQRACGVQCENDSACRDAGLVGFVCDTRPLEVVDDSFAGNSAPYNFCVNPTCG